MRGQVEMVSKDLERLQMQGHALSGMHAKVGGTEWSEGRSGRAQTGKASSKCSDEN